MESVPVVRIGDAHPNYSDSSTFGVTISANSPRTGSTNRIMVALKRTDMVGSQWNLQIKVSCYVSHKALTCRWRYLQQSTVRI